MKAGSDPEPADSKRLAPFQVYLMVFDESVEKYRFEQCMKQEDGSNAEKPSSDCRKKRSWSKYTDCSAGGNRDSRQFWGSIPACQSVGHRLLQLLKGCHPK